MLHIATIEDAAHAMSQPIKNIENSLELIKLFRKTSFKLWHSPNIREYKLISTKQQEVLQVYRECKECGFTGWLDGGIDRVQCQCGIINDWWAAGKCPPLRHILKSLSSRLIA